MQILMSHKAYDDINSIFLYISHDSVKYANKTIQHIYSTIDSIKNFPYIGSYLPIISNSQFRERIYKSYRIIYEISEDTDFIYIHFIIHSKQNFKLLKKIYF